MERLHLKEKEDKLESEQLIERTGILGLKNAYQNKEFVVQIFFQVKPIHLFKNKWQKCMVISVSNLITFFLNIYIYIASYEV